ncbi:MAG: conjugal transfer protein TraX, partial [Oscillospiraceae bacterium]|nr:conjugal transfer protein TraX [Oscillospiraceae bacterium]
FRGKKWWQRLAQLLLLFYINNEILAGVTQNFSLFGHAFSFHRQLFALLALIPIWLYRGRQGHHSKAFQYFCYAFYPLHLAVLAIIKLI